MNGLEIFILVFLYVCVAWVTGCLYYVLGEDEEPDKENLIGFATVIAIVWPMTIIILSIYYLLELTCKILRKLLKK